MRLHKPTHSCRVCRTSILGEPLIAYENMPCAAQNFPTANNLDADKGSHLAVYQCTNCGLVQLQDPPVPYYREVIRATAFSAAMKEFRQAQLNDWVNRYQLAEKNVLEVGCGKGEYLSLLEEAGLRPHGIEFCTQSVQSARSCGYSITKGFLSRPDQKLRHAPFDAFASFNFMEHWPSPVHSLQGIKSNLVEGGLGLIEVPNFDMILQKGLFSEFISDHLSYFTRETFAFTLQSSGFEVLECNSIWYNYILSAVVKKRQQTDFSKLKDKQFSIKDALVSFLDRYPEHSVAVWGAGHQALAAIALSGVSHQIKYVIDSAPFKQGKFTSATHLPIVAPDTLMTDPVTAIIVMAAGYSDEVCKIIRTQLRLDLPVVKLSDSGLETSP